jgi:hypothetical protein
VIVNDLPVTLTQFAASALPGAAVQPPALASAGVPDETTTPVAAAAMTANDAIA